MRYLLIAGLLLAGCGTDETLVGPKGDTGAEGAQGRAGTDAAVVGLTIRLIAVDDCIKVILLKNQAVISFDTVCLKDKKCKHEKD